MKRMYFMILNKHFNLEGRHARLSPSQYHWVNYDEDKFLRVYAQQEKAAQGDRLHKLAMQLINEGVKLPRSPKTLNMYVNDAIGYRMTPEQPLFYSENFFGTADALKFTLSKMHLRVHDLKTGVTPAKITQLELYCTLFCLEYGFKPFELEMEARIYQNDEVQIFDIDPDVIFRMMEKAKFFDKLIRERKEAELS
jgi:hypothetical protein